MTSPLNNNFNTVSSSLNISNGQGIPQEKEGKEKEVGEPPIGSTQLARFAAENSRVEGKEHSPRSSFTYVTPDGLPTPEVLKALVELGKQVKTNPLLKLAVTLHNVCKHGLITQERAAELRLSINVSMDKNPNKTTVSLNYIYSPKGIGISLAHEAKGGLSVSLEREKMEDDPLFGMNLSDSEVLSELSERAHQTILVSIPVHVVPSTIAGDLGKARLILATAKGIERGTNEGAHLGYRGRDGSNEITVEDSVTQENFGFILVPERLLPFIRNMQAPCPIHTVSSKKMELYFYGDRVEVSCPDYESKLEELHKASGQLTHVVREKTKSELT